MVNRRPQLQLIAPTASPEEAAAIVAALERFMRATAPAPAGRRRQARSTAGAGRRCWRAFGGSPGRIFPTPG